MMTQRRRARQLCRDTSRAGLLRTKHYHRRDRHGLDAPLATSDPHLLDTCAAEGIAVVVLPDARGAVWAG